MLYRIRNEINFHIEYIYGINKDEIMIYGGEYLKERHIRFYQQ